MDNADVLYVCNRILSAIKKNEIMPFTATRMGPEIIIQSKKEKAKCNMISLIYGIKNMTKMNIPAKEKQSQIHRE